MSLSNGQNHGWVELGTRAPAHAVSWPAACVVVGVLLVLLAYRVAAERSRRHTVLALCAYAPGGTVVVQETGPGGPAMWVWIGDRPRPAPDGTPAVVAAAPASNRRECG